MYLSIYIQSNERIEYIMYIFIFKNQLSKNIFVASHSHASVIGCILVAGKLSNPKFTSAKSVQSFQTRASWCNQAKTNFDQKHD
jgi:hypothetical protein